MKSDQLIFAADNSDGSLALDVSNSQYPVIPTSVFQDNTRVEPVKHIFTSANVDNAMSGWYSLLMTSQGAKFNVCGSIGNNAAVRSSQFDSLFFVLKKAAARGNS